MITAPITKDNISLEEFIANPPPRGWSGWMVNWWKKNGMTY